MKSVCNSERGNTCAAAYVRMSTERQVYSTQNQLDSILQYATERNISVVKIYEDAGKSGLTKRGRPGLSRLIEDVQHSPDFELILVFDVSRWGRFQDVDESAHYEYVCRTHGVNVAYCAEEFINDGSPYAAIIKALKRVAAADYSRQLSAKVFTAQCRMVKMGYKTGGPPGYGLRRILLSADGDVIRTLETGEWKFLQTQRVILAPGPAFEVAVVNQMYAWYVAGAGDRKIARVLNDQAVVTETGGPWTADIVRGMLRNEKYIGNLIFNRRSSKLRNRAIRNPPEQWVRRDGAFEGIVPIQLFNAAQVERTRRYRRYDRKELVAILQRIQRQHGRVTSTLIDIEPDSPTARLIARHFGSLFNAYSAAGIPNLRNRDFLSSRVKNYAFRTCVLKEIEDLIDRAGGKSQRSEAPYTLLINEKVKLSVRIIRCCHDLTHDYYRWRIPQYMAEGVDFVLAAQLDQANNEIVRYLLLNAALLADRNIAFTEKSFSRYEYFGRRTLAEFFFTQS
jgi:DNA invertase Pin-like site-specific DNA recombinase